ncbi:MAG: two-component regulator propeller domain-containing protein [Bacteroidota bacterium]|nr:two-component regulator propeller domain-containing protein [Bacteroidota bacterium]
MKNIFRIILFAILSIFSLPGFSQGVPIGQWQDDLPYFQCISVTEAGNKIYCATPYSIFSVDKDDNSVQRLSKINGLSDIGISRISFNKNYNTLIIAYTDANIDLIKNNTIINISDIERSTILGNKTINDIYFIGKYAYLACGFGIVVLDIDKEEIKDTYYIGSQGGQVNVLGLTKDDQDTLFVASEKGLYKAWINDPNLANFNRWSKVKAMDTTAYYSHIYTFSGEVFAVKSDQSTGKDTIYRYKSQKWTPWILDSNDPVSNITSGYNHLIISYDYFVKYFDSSMNLINTVHSYFPGNPRPNDAIIDKDYIIWIADNYAGLMRYNISTAVVQSVPLSGPLTAKAFSMTTNGNDLYIAPGGRDNSYTPLSVQAQIYHYDGSIWRNIQSYNNPRMSSCLNVVTIAVDPNDSKHMYAGTWGSGLLELRDDSVINKYDESNSTLRHHSLSPDASDIRIGGLAYDSDGNLWVVNTHNNNFISRKSGDKWTGYNMSIVNESDLGNMVIDKSNQKWIIMRYTNSSPYSLLVFSDNNTPDNAADDQAKKLNSSPGNGNIPGNTVYALAVDKNGAIWIGTEEGIGVIYTPENVFTNESFDAQRILVTQGTYTQYLMENELVTAIAIDGGNRKWIGTDRGGIYLFSEDGTTQIYHFTSENSPLLSDRIVSIAINPENGEVYIGTDKGVITFKGTATEGTDSFGTVYAYPNPVKEDYAGYIAIKGLVTGAQVRITDVDGKLIYSTKAEGGQAIWNGKNFKGRKASSGVYLVFAANDDGSEKVVTKILIIH